VDVQICAIAFFIFRLVGEGKGSLRWTTWLIHYNKPDSHPTVLFIPSNSVLQLHTFDSSYSLVVSGKDFLSGGERVRYYKKKNPVVYYSFITSKIIYLIFFIW